MTTVHDDGDPRRSTKQPNRRWVYLLAALTLLGVLLMIALAPASRLAANRLPLRPVDPTKLVEGSVKSGTTAIRELPVGLPTGQRIAHVQDVYPYAVAALGAPGAQALMGVLSSPGELAPNTSPHPGAEFFGYPYHYSVLEPILANAPEAPLRRNATALGAALIELAGQPQLRPQTGYTMRGAASAAYAVLDRTRASGGCDAQLDLLLLLAGDSYTSTRTLAGEYRNSSAACPNDPTPGWVTGQALMRRLEHVEERLPIRFDNFQRTDLALALATFRGLVSRFPRDTSVVTGLGDAYLRAGLLLLSSEPFTARDDLWLAVAQYNRAAELGDRHAADLGRARALIGLEEPERAVQLATRAVGDSPHPGAALEVLLAAEQAARHFDSAQEVARRLERLGLAAYPDAVAFYPAPSTSERGEPFDGTLLLSMGADTLAPMDVALTPAGGRGGGLVEDLGFIPRYRNSYLVTSTLTDCPSLAWRRDAVIAGQAASALADWPDELPASRPNLVQYGCGDSTNTLRSIAELAAHQPLTERSSLTTDQITDEWQNMLRWAGDLTGARAVIAAWDQLKGDDSPLPALRLGEVAFRQGAYNEAATEFGIAARRAHGRPSHDDDLSAARAELGRGAALLKAERNAEAVALLRPLEVVGTRGYAMLQSSAPDAAAQWAILSYYAAIQLGDYESATGDLRGAIDDYNVATSWSSKLWPLHSIRPEAVYNNLALAYLGVEATDLATTNADRAIHADPMNPVFLMTAGFIADRARNTGQAADYDQRALRSDPGAFPAANDLGVELARIKDYGGAEVAFRQAVGANRDYALGWFDLGVLESLRGPMHLLASQGAFAKAFALDTTLKDRRRELTIDGNVYRTALDLSQPIPPRWSLSQTQKAAPIAAAGLLGIGMLAVGLARASSRRGSDLAKRWLDPVSKRLEIIRGPAWLRRPVWAVAATVAAFSAAYVRHVSGLTEMVAYAMGIVFLVGAAMLARVAVAAQANVSAAQTSWLPGMLFGITAGAIGIPWAPLPVAKADPQSQRLHLAAPFTLAVLAVILFVESAWLHVPLSQSFAVAALIMAGSVLIPVKPLDGAEVGKTGLVAAAGVVGVAFLVSLGIV